MASSALALKPDFIYGLNSRTKQNAYFVGNEQIVYPAGGVLVMQDLHERPRPYQQYIELHHKHKPLNVMCVSPNKELVATGEGGGDPQLSLYSVTHRKYLGSLDMLAGIRAADIACLQFTCDAQFLIAVTGEPDWMLLCYNVAARSLDSKTRANTNAGEVAQVACNPADATTLSVVGPGLFRLLQLVDGSWRQFGFYKAHAFPLRSVAWLTADRLLAGTEDGRLLLIECNELKAVFEAAGLAELALSPKHGSSLEDTIPGPANQSVAAISSLGNGFVIGFGNPCNVAVYEYEGTGKYRITGNFVLRPNPVKQDASDVQSDEEANSVWSLDVSPDRKTLLVSSVQVQLYTAPLTTLKTNDCPEHFLVPLGQPLHRGAVVGLSMCVWRPLFASCGLQDKSVRIWNYDSGRQELCKLDDFVVIRELAVRGCKDCKFSIGGQLFALAHENHVTIISTITFEKTQSLSAHCAQVTSVSWSADDTRLVTCGADGAVYEWDVATGRRIEEVVTKGWSYQAVSTLGAGKISYAVAGDAGIREICRSKLVRVVPCSSESADLYLVTALLSYDGHALMLASRCGTVLTTFVPLPETSAMCNQVCMHSAPVTKLAISRDGHTVVSCAEDGSMCLWHLGDAPRDTIALMQSVEQVMVGRGQLCHLKDVTATLSQRLASHCQEQEAALRHQAEDFERTMTATVAKHEEDMRQLKLQMEQSATQHDSELEALRMSAENNSTEHAASLEALEEFYQLKLLTEFKRLEELQQLLEAQQKDSDSKLIALQETRERELAATCREYEERIRNLTCDIEKMSVESSEATALHEEVVRQIEHDTDKEILLLKSQHERELRETRQQIEQINGEIQIARKRATGHRGEISRLEQEMRGLQDEVTRNKNCITGQEQYIAEQGTVLQRNNLLLDNKERELAEVRNQLAKQKKEKECLVSQLELREQEMRPKEEEIANKSNQLEQLIKELRSERQLRCQLQAKLYSLSTQLKQIRRHAQKEATCRGDTERDMRRLQARVYELDDVLHNPQQLLKAASELYQDFGRDGAKGDQPKDTLMELKRQLGMQQNLQSSLSEKLKLSEERHRQQKNTLRKEILQLSKRIELLTNSDKQVTDEHQEMFPTVTAHLHRH